MRKILIYTDGSHLNKQSGHGRLGCGGVMVEDNGDGYGKFLDEYSKELLPADLEKDFGSSNVSNPTAEMIGALEALRNFNIPSDARVIMKADYEGNRNWMMGIWSIKEPYIKKVKEAIDAEIERQHLQGRIGWEWVKGHQKVLNQDSYWNNRTDILAKGQ